MQYILKKGVLLGLLFLSHAIHAQLSVLEITAEEAATRLTGEGITPLVSSHLGGSNQLGYFTGGSSIFGIESGIVLATGDVALAATGNGGPAEHMPANGTGYAVELAAEHPDFDFYDATELYIRFEATSTEFQFDIVFASDEYLEYVGSEYNDVMGVYLQGPGFEGPYAGAQNISIIPGTSDPVSIQTVNTTTNASWYINNPNGDVLDPSPYPITYDGFTQKMTIAVTGLTCGENYKITFAIADVSDKYMDAALFIGENSIKSNFALNEIDLGEDPPYCEGEAFAASITHNAAWNYNWSTGDEGLGVSTTSGIATLGVNSLAVTVDAGDGCVQERNVYTPVHPADNTPPYLLNTVFTYYTYPDETVCFSINSADYPTEEVTMTPIGLPTYEGYTPYDVQQDYADFCWTSKKKDYGVHTFTIQLEDNNECFRLSNSYQFSIEVLCPLCPLCVAYENRTPDANPLPAVTEAGKCITAGLTEPVVVGEAVVEFKAGEYIELGDFFTEGPFFAEILGASCAAECGNCCDNVEPFTYDAPPVLFTPNGDGVNDIWFLNDAANPLCAFNADAYTIEVVNRWGVTVYEKSNDYNYCCPFAAATPENELAHTEIYWDGTNNSGDYVPHATYFIKVTLKSCSGAQEVINVTVQNWGPDPGKPAFDHTFNAEDSTTTPIAHTVLPPPPQIVLYPQPASNYLMLETAAVFKAGFTLQVIDTKGQLICTKNVTTNTYRLNTAAFSAGVYMLVLFDENTTLRTKIICI